MKGPSVKKSNNEFEDAILNVEKEIQPIGEATRNLLVFVNPESGSGKAYKMFRDEVIPALTSSNTRFHLIITDRSNCAREVVKSTDLSQWTAIIIVSGDGLLNEVVNGLMERPDWKTAIKTPLGMIPGGSGNGMARSVFYHTWEQYEGRQVPTATRNIISGSTTPVDLVRVDTLYNGPIYSFLSCGMGIMSDIDIESERLRAFGETRFSLYAIIRAINIKMYHARVTFLPIPEWNPDHKIQVPDHMYKITRRQALAEHLSWQNCYRKVSWRKLRAAYLRDIDSSSGSGDDCGLPPLPAINGNWVTMQGDFGLIYATYQTYLGKDVFFTPFARPNDGIIWLALIYSGVSRTHMIHILSHLSTGTYINSDKVDMIPVRCFRLEPLTSAGHLTIDGELIDTQPIQATVLPSIARIMSRKSNLEV